MNFRFTLIAVCLLGLLCTLLAAPAFCQVQMPQLVAQIGHSGWVNSVAFSPDGRTLASGSEDHTLKLWDTATGQELRTITGHTGAVRAVAFSPDGRTLASGGDDEAIRLWDAATGKEVHTLVGDTVTVNVSSVAFSPDGNMLASGSDDTVKIWDAVTGKLLRTLTGHVYSVNSVAFSPDSKTLASGSADHTIKIWDVTDGKKLRTLAGSDLDVLSVAFSPDGKTLASGRYLTSDATHKAIEIWDTATWRLLHTSSHDETANSVAFSPDGRTLASGTGHDTVKVLDIATGKLLRTLAVPADQVSLNQIKSVAYSPDGTTIACGIDDNTVKLLDTATGKLLHTLTGHANEVTSVAFSPDGSTLACGINSPNGDFDYKIRLWDTTTGNLLHSLTGHLEPVNYVAFSPNGKTLASGSDDETIKIWDAATGKELHTLTGSEFNVLSVAFSPNGKTLAGGNRRMLDSPLKTIKIWDTATGHLQRTLAGHTDTVHSVAFSPDGRTLASGSEDTTIKLWDAANGHLQRTLAGHDGPVYSVAFSPNGKTLASGSPDAAVKLWDTTTGKLLRTLDVPDDDSLTQTKPVAFSPDGKTLASSGDRTVKLWDTTTGNPLHSLSGHANHVNSVAFSPDGKTLASGSDDHTLKLWDTATGQELATLYSLGDTGWAVFAPDGRFDSSNLDNIQDVHWVLPNQPFTPIPVEAFFAQYFTPGLLAHLLNRDPLPELPDISQINHVQPQVAIDTIAPHPGGDPTLVDVTVSYSGQQAEALLPGGKTRSETSGVYDLRLFRNGQLVAALPEDAAPGAAPVDLSGGTVGKIYTQTFTVRLAQDGAKTVPFTAYAFNEAKVKSQTASREYTPKTPLPVVKGRAWVVAFGVNAYSDPHWNLHFAAADAHAFGEQLVPRVQETRQYSRVTFVPLVSDTDALAPDALPATKAALRAVLGALAGKTPEAETAKYTPTLQKLGVSKAAPEDMVLLAFSCHGDTDPKTGEYYLFPADIGPDQSHGLTPDLESRSLSSAELTAWMQGLDAGEMAMVIDSCHSAAAAGQAFKPSPMDSPGLGQLAYYKRMRILSASQADAAAKEYPDLGHGLLTAALLGDGLVSGGAKPVAGQSVLTMGPWLTFAEADVPLLDVREKGQRGRRSQAGKLGKKEGSEKAMFVYADPEASKAMVQRPSLFDFHRLGAHDAAVCISTVNKP